MSGEIKEIQRVGTILVITMFAFTMLTIFALCEKIDNLETKIEKLK
jgi:hypothetical protein